MENYKNRPAATPEPMSKPGRDYVLAEVIKDLEARDRIGQKKYGTSLQTFNGRDALNDFLQEQYDGIMYLKQAIMERDLSKESLEEKIVKWANDRSLYKSATHESQLSKLHEEIGEWQEEVLSGDRCAEMLELGDMYVVLVNIARMRGFSLEHCGWAAYGKIKDRTGHMENGTFVKDHS